MEKMYNGEEIQGGSIIRIIFLPDNKVVEENLFVITSKANLFFGIQSDEQSPMISEGIPEYIHKLLKDSMSDLIVQEEAIINSSLKWVIGRKLKKIANVVFKDDPTMITGTALILNNAPNIYILPLNDGCSAIVTDLALLEDKWGVKLELRDI